MDSANDFTQYNNVLSDAGIYIYKKKNIPAWINFDVTFKTEESCFLDRTLHKALKTAQFL